MVSLSVVIPLAPGEMAWQTLWPDLMTLPKAQSEIVWVLSDQDTANYQRLRDMMLPNIPMRLLYASPGRATQMNAGAQVAQGDYIWFLHADSQFAKKTVSALFSTLHWQQSHYDCNTNALLFFDLVFKQDALSWMRLNEWGVRFRSRMLGLPFGDQGFCLKKTVFEALGGFSDNVEYGEDHLLVWKARKQGIAIQAVGAILYTSARKYQRLGWFYTTCLHQYLWIKQAWWAWRQPKDSL